MENLNKEKNTNQLDPKITEAVDKLFVDAKAGDREALKVLVEIFHAHFKEMQKISFREQMRQNYKEWRNHKEWYKHYKNSHKF